MSGPMLTISVDNSQLHDALARALVALKDTTPIMREIAANMQDAAERAFLATSDPATGTIWKPLSKSRQRQRAKKGRSDANILQDTGQLVSSVSGQSAGGIFEVGPGFARVGTNVPYAAAHQFGATIQRKAGAMTVRLRKVKSRWQFAKQSHKRVRTVETVRKAYSIHIPARPFLGVGQQDIDDMLNVIARRIGGAFAKNAV